MDTAPSTRSRASLRWRQFSLKALLLATLLACAALGAWRITIYPFTAQQRAIAALLDLGASVQTEAGGKEWMRRWLGADNLQHIVYLDLADADDPSKYMPHLSTLPRIRRLAVGGEAFSDDHLRQFRKLRSLQFLVLDSTSVSDEEINRLKTAIPGVQVRRSQRLAIKELDLLGALETRSWPPADSRQSNSGNAVNLPPTSMDAFQFDAAHFLDIVSFSVVQRDIDPDRLRVLRRTPTVQVLVLAEGLSIDDDALNHFSQLDDLRVLDLRATGVSDDGLLHIRRFSRLEALLVDRTSVGDSGLKNLSGACGRLKKLTFDQTQVTDAGLPDLQSIGKLEVVFLPDSITETGLPHLHLISSLRQVWIDSAQVSDHAVTAFKEKMPQVRVVQGIPQKIKK